MRARSNFTGPVPPAEDDYMIVTCPENFKIEGKLYDVHESSIVSDIWACEEDRMLSQQTFYSFFTYLGS